MIEDTKQVKRPRVTPIDVWSKMEGAVQNSTSRAARQFRNLFGIEPSLFEKMLDSNLYSAIVTAKIKTYTTENMMLILLYRIKTAALDYQVPVSFFSFVPDHR